LNQTLTPLATVRGTFIHADVTQSLRAICTALSAAYYAKAFFDQTLTPLATPHCLLISAATTQSLRTALAARRAAGRTKSCRAFAIASASSASRRNIRAGATIVFCAALTARLSAAETNSSLQVTLNLSAMPVLALTVNNSTHLLSSSISGPRLSISASTALP